MDKLFEDLLTTQDDISFVIEEIIEEIIEDEIIEEIIDDKIFTQNPFRFSSDCNCKTCKELNNYLNS